MSTFATNGATPKELCKHRLQEVAELRQGKAWDDQLLDQTFNEEIAEHIRLNVHYEGSEGYWDRPYWMPTPSGKFSVSSAWQILRHMVNPNQEFKLMWIKDLPFKISFFLWRLWRQKIATDDMWRRQGQMVMSRYYKKLVVCSVLSKIKAIISSSTSYHHLGALEEKKCRRVTWQLLFHGWYKYNIDGDSKGNPGPIFLGFCVSDDEGDVVYARAVDLGVTTNVVAEAKAILEGFEYCVEYDLHPLILETNSLVMKKAIEWEWDPPWLVASCNFYFGLDIL
ncbi:uncharacterized protein [Nicotiana tomentosiformis]|uniref:uncharacterized protein n=1 Tax=Nicotiana tomentosiformis TaxID=4098 RepID=UPI00388CC7DC